MDDAIWQIWLPMPDAVLEISPRWLQFSAPWHAGLFLVLSLLPFILIIALYRYEMRLTPRLPAALLLTLRLGFYLSLWCLICLEPVLAHVVSERLPSRVAIAVDRSPSMDFADPQRSVIEKLRLANGLKLHGDDSLIASWIAHHEHKDAVPSFASEQERALYLKICSEVDALTRTQCMRRILNEDGRSLLKRLANDHAISVIAFANNAWEPAPSDLWVEAPQRSTGTDLQTPLKRAVNDDGKLLGIILLSDGRHTSSNTPRSSTPIYTVGLGSKNAPPDIAITEVKAPSSVLKDADAHFEVRVRAIDIPQQDLIVELRKTGESSPLETKTIKHSGTADAYTLQFHQSMKEAGTHHFEVAVRTSKETVEITNKNNALPAIVRVVEDKARVLLVDGEARWEYQYIANALARDETVDLERVLFQQPRLGKTPEAELERTGSPKRKFPEITNEIDPLMDFDCIILGDVSPDDLSLPHRERLEKYVAERGGTLVVVAGKRYMPGVFCKEGTDIDPIAKLLPVSAPQVIKPAAGFTLKFTHDGSATPFLQMDPAPERNTQEWARMPAHFWGAIGRLKPGATSLAYYDDKSIAKPDGSSPENTQSLIAQQNFGFGKVLYLGLDSTWRWRYRAGDTFHHRFWGQLTRWAAADKLLPAGNRFVRFGSREPVYHEGQSAEILVRLNAETATLPKDAAASVRVFRIDDKDAKEIASAPLKTTEGQPRLLQAQLGDLPTGNFRVQLVIPFLKDKIDDKDNQATFTVTPATPRELRDLSSDWPLLTELARQSHGKFFTAENVDQLVDLLARKVTIREHRTEQRLWQDAPLVWWVLATMLALLTIEWLVRKTVGLP